MSYPITGKKINKMELGKRINDYIALLKVKVYVMSIIKPLLNSLEGKQVSKRIETKAKELLPEFTIYYSVGYVEHELKIWGNGIDSNNMITIRLCRNDSNKTLSNEYVFQYDWYDFQKSIDQLTGFCAGMNEHIKQWNEMIDYLELQSEVFKDIPYPASEYFYMRNLIK